MAVVEFPVPEGEEVGPIGPPGPQGPPGQPKFSGHGVPIVVPGAHPGDSYLDLDTMLVYELQ